jgi:hypothetical protein
MAKLLISGQQAWKKHEETKASFLILPVTPTRFKELRKEAKDSAGEVDFIRFCGLIAPEAIADWKDVGAADADLPCDKGNLKAFATNHATTIMPWVINEATSLDRFRLEEKDAAKNV